MKRRTEESRQIVNRFLEELGQPVPQEEAARRTGQVLDRLRRGDGQAVGSVSAVSRRKNTWGWAAIAAGIAALITGGILQIVPFRSSEPEVVARSVDGELLIDGARGGILSSPEIQTGRMVRSGAGGGTVGLLDGSQIEMGPDTEMTVVRARDGLRVLLVSGNLIVTAAKQGGGHLYVETRDCVVSVVGTVFTVKAEETGSRVSVIEGEVHVQRGEISQTLLPGQQIATSPELGPVPLETEVKWSRSAEGLAALAQQSIPAAPPPGGGTTQVLRGVVTNGNGSGIPDVTVTLCTTPDATADSRRREGFVQATPAQNDGPDRRESRAAFYAIWDATVCPSPRTAMTGSDGRFEFSDVARGNYVVKAERQGFLAPLDAAATDASAWRAGTAQYFYLIQGRTVRTAAGQTVTSNVTVGDGQVPEVSLKLVEGAVIAGIVRDSSGRTVANAAISVVPASQGNTTEQKTAVQTTTNDRGEYRAYWLYPGEYKVVARPSGALSYSLEYAYRGALSDRTSESRSLSFSRGAPETWYPRVGSEAEATDVPVREGEEVPGIDIVLRD